MKLIVAMDINNGIGKNNTLPWHYSEDLQYFKNKTLDCNIVMGYNTWLSLPNKLPHRTNIVLSTKNEVEGADKVISIIEDIPYNAWIIGGKQVIDSTIHLVNEIHITRIPHAYDCDTFLDLPLNEFTLSHEIPLGVQLKVQIYKRN